MERRYQIKPIEIAMLAAVNTVSNPNDWNASLLLAVKSDSLCDSIEKGSTPSHQ
jgi:hypothetical protein